MASSPLVGCDDSSDGGGDGSEGDGSATGLLVLTSRPPRLVSLADSSVTEVFANLVPTAPRSRDYLYDGRYDVSPDCQRLVKVAEEGITLSDFADLPEAARLHALR
ncbi:MAG: hypothetical protein PVI30_25150 [Myxococcales bacterium]